MMKKKTKTNSAHIYLPLLRRKIRLHNIIDTMRLHDTNIILYGIMPLIDSLHYSTIPKVITKYDNDTIPIIIIKDDNIKEVITPYFVNFSPTKIIHNQLYDENDLQMVLENNPVELLTWKELLENTSKIIELNKEQYQNDTLKIKLIESSYIKKIDDRPVLINISNVKQYNMLFINGCIGIEYIRHFYKSYRKYCLIDMCKDTNTSYTYYIVYSPSYLMNAWKVIRDEAFKVFYGYMINPQYISNVFVSEIDL